MTSDERAELDLLNELQTAQMARNDELERRLYQLEARVGLTNETGPNKMLVAESEHDREERHDEEVLAAEDYVGVPLAYGFTPGRAPTTLYADGFDTFDQRTTSGGSAMDQFKELVAESLARRTNPDESATRADDKALQPADYRGVPIARGF